MEPFIQLSYSEQCPKQALQLTQTSFIDKRNVPKRFWLDLLETKCPEGLGEVSDSLVNDQNLTPAKFLDEQRISPNASYSQENSDTCCTSPKPVACYEFKTPLTSRYGHKISVTPSLFSQDEIERVNLTPVSSLKCSVRTQSQPTFNEDTKSAHGSPGTLQVLCTPAALSRRRSSGGWSKRRTKTPDLLAEIMGQRRSSLSCLLAGGDDDETTEWSDSMATPPLKITITAADEADSQEEREEKTAEEEDHQPTSKRIARVLFSGSATNQSMEPLELSLDDVVTDHKPLDALDTKDTVERAKTADSSCLVEEFLLEYSCRGDSTYRDQDRPENVLEESLVASPSVNMPCESNSKRDDEVSSTSLENVSRLQYSEPHRNPNQLYSPFPNSFLSPSTRSPLKALAQSTPKPSISSSTGRNAAQNNRSTSNEHGVSRRRDTHVLIYSPSLSCEKAPAEAVCDVTCHATEVNCNIAASDVTFGSPSRSFEVAMVREADKLCCGMYSRNSELGSSLSPSINAQSLQTDNGINETTGDQSTEVLDHFRETAINSGNATESTTGTLLNGATETTSEILVKQDTVTTRGYPMNQVIETITGNPTCEATETTPGSVDDCSNLSRRSYCKVPSLRRSARPKRFSYPSVRQVAKQDIGKPLRENTVAVDNSPVLGKDKSTTTVKNCHQTFDDGTVCYVRSDKGGQSEVPVAKKLKICENRQECESERDIAQVSSSIKYTDKDDDGEVCDLSSNKGDEDEMPVAKKLKIYENRQGCESERDATLVSSLINDTDEEDDVLFDMDALSQFPVEYMLSPPSLHCDTDAFNVDNCSSERHEMNVTFTITTKETDSSIENIGPLGDCKSNDIDPEFACFHKRSGVLISSKALTNAKATMAEVDSSLGVNEGPSEDQPGSSNIRRNQQQVATLQKQTSSTNLVDSCCRGKGIEELDLNRRAGHAISKDNISDTEEQQKSPMPAFCGFSTASGKQVRVSEAAMEQARETLREIDDELNVNSSVQTLKATSEKEGPSDGIRNKHRASEKKLGTLLDFQEVPCNETRNNLANMFPDSLDSIKKHHGNEVDVVLPQLHFSNWELCKESAHGYVHTASGNANETKDAALQNEGEIETKQSENFHDSLLEDLLNDCKMKRRDSMDTIREENERMEEHHRENPILDKDSELSSFNAATVDREALERQENIATEWRLGAASRKQPTSIMSSCDVGFHTASGKSVSVSEEAVTKARNTWNKIEEELTLVGPDSLPSIERESVNGFQKVPARTIYKVNVDEMKDPLIFVGANKPAAITSGFMGFQTAGGKAVEISEGALQTAKGTLKKIDQALFSEGQSKSRADSPSLFGFEKAIDRDDENTEETLKFATEIIKEANKDISKEGQCGRVASFSTIMGFQTAAENDLSFSEEAMKTGNDMERLAADSSIEPLGKKNETSSLGSIETRFHLANTNNISVSKQAVETERRGHGSINNRSGFHTALGKRQVNIDAKYSLGNIFVEEDKSTDFSGFQTASEKRVKVSAEALQKGTQIMQQIDSSLEQNICNGRQNAHCLSGVASLYNSTGKSGMSDESLQEKTRITHQLNNTLEQKNGEMEANGIKFAGFQTAAGKSLMLSEEALRKGAQIMQEIDSSLPKSEDKTGFYDFDISAGKCVNLSNKSLEKEATIMQQIDKSLHESKGSGASTSRSVTRFSGFQTASGQSAKVSKESLEKGATIMQQIDKSLEQSKGISGCKSRSSTGFSGFQCATGQSVELSKESLEKGATIMQQIDKSLEQSKGNSASTTRSPTGFSGFQTASGQNVKLSKESLEKGATIMQQIDKSLEQSKNNGASTPRSPGFSGFQTASGQSVKLSKESLEKGATIMQQVDKSLEQSKGISGKSRSSTGFSGFQTANGQNVKLSKESLEKGATIMQQIDKSLEQSKGISGCNSRSTTGFSGFQTASGQSVKLSEESLEKGAMHQIDASVAQSKGNGTSTPRRPTGFSGFQTTSGQSVKLSKESLEKGATIMQEINKSPEVKVREGDHSTTSFSAFSGFQTAGGKSVQISDSALAKARETMAGIESELRFQSPESGSPSFQTVPKTDSTIPAVSIEVKGVTTPTPEGSRCAEDDEVVSREILESSEALLADEPFMDVSEYLHDRQKRSAAARSSFDSPRLVDRRKGKHHTGVASGSNHVLTRRHSTPLHCSEDMFSTNHTATRNGMKPYNTTPSGVLHDRRARSFHAPLRARLAGVENIQSSYSPSLRRHSDTDTKISSRSSDSNRSLRPLQALTPNYFKSKTEPCQKTSTPLNSSTNRRTFGPRPPFITPYRKQEASREISPLARCSTSRLLVSDLSEGHGSGVTEPCSKKQRISAPDSTLNTRSRQNGEASKIECTVKPQPGFLSQVRRCNQRIKIRELVRNATPGGYSTTELLELGVSSELLSITPSNAGSFRFVGRKYFSEAVISSDRGVRTEDGGILRAGTDGSVGLAEIQSAFCSTPGVDKQLISEEWIANHNRWIIWKLAALEVAFPQQFAGRCLTPDWVLCQLKYRYDREIDNSNRSALKKILERDDVPSRTMVLCVASVSVTNNQTESVAQEHKDQDGENDAQGTTKKSESSSVIELTDGWYGIRGLLDRPLTRLLNDNRIVVGQKLCVYGAELVGSEQAVSPLEAPSSLMLRLHANSTRRARWDTKLGFHSHAHAFPLPLASLFGDGGFTGCVDVIVLRQYPVQWMEKMPDGTNVFRNSRLEEREAKTFEADRHQRREKLFLQIQGEFESESWQPDTKKRRSARFRRRSFSSRDLRELNDGKEIYEALTQASDPDAVKECLDERQVRALEEHQRLLQERKFAELQNKFERVWKEQEEECQLQRNVVPLLKVRITDYRCRGQAKQNAVLSIWRPSEEVMHLLSEGSRLRIYHLTAAGVRYRQGASELQFSATRTTRYEMLSIDAYVITTSYVQRQACSFDQLCCGSFQQCSEVDIVGLVVFCSPLSCFSSSSSSVQTVYLSDEESNLVAIKFWGGLKAVAVEDLVKPRNFICCSNLTVRPDDRLKCPALSFSELSSLTLKPHEPHLRTALNNLQHNIPDINLFMAHIQDTLTTILRPRRTSPSTDFKVNVVRMYGKTTDTAPAGGLQKYDPTATKQLSGTVNTSHSAGIVKENCLCFNDEEDRFAQFAQSIASNHGNGEAQEARMPGFEEPSSLHVTNASESVKSRQAKRKMLDSIPEPPPLSPLPSSIPVSVRREFKRPRQVGSPGSVRLEQ